MDQNIEETINKYIQIPGRTNGGSLRPVAVQKYDRNAECRSISLRQLRKMVGPGGSKLNHPDLQRPRILSDETDIQTFVTLMDNSWINNFMEDQDNPVNMATGDNDNHTNC